MPAEIVLLINLPPDETEHIQGVLAQADMYVASRVVPGFEEAEAFVQDGTIVLAVLRLDEGRSRPDQDIRRIKRLLPKSVPMLALLPPEFARKVKDLLRAGADEYWILPMDDASFPPRLHIMLDWGQSMASSEQARGAGDELPRPAVRKWLRYLKGILRRLFTFKDTVGPMVMSELNPVIGGKWARIRRLGFGSFGEVWLMQERSKEALAVAKVPHSPKLNTKFLREAAILKRLAGHPNAVQLVEVIKEDGRIIIIQEYVEGATLQEHMDQGMESAAREKGFLDLLAVVSYAHEQNIMHRDIKPENIIITRTGVLKLLDFGTGKDMTRRNISSTVIGSRPFMAPEQIMGKSRLASDVWALGVILYTLSTGCLPFYDDNEKQLMDMILEVEPEAPRNLEPGLPEALEAILLKCLQKDWNRRYRSAVELRDDLLARFPEIGSGEVLP